MVNGGCGGWRGAAITGLVKDEVKRKEVLSPRVKKVEVVEEEEKVTERE